MIEDSLQYYCLRHFVQAGRPLTAAEAMPTAVPYLAQGTATSLKALGLVVQLPDGKYKATPAAKDALKNYERNHLRPWETPLYLTK